MLKFNCDKKLNNLFGWVFIIVLCMALFDGTTTIILSIVKCLNHPNKFQYTSLIVIWIWITTSGVKYIFNLFK